MDTVEVKWQDCMTCPPDNDDVILVKTDHSLLPMLAMYDNDGKIYTSPQGYQIVWPDRWLSIPQDYRS